MAKLSGFVSKSLNLIGDACTVLTLVGIPIAIPMGLFPEQAYRFYQMMF